MLAPMHEWALADAVVSATSAALSGRDPSCLRGVMVMIGELQALDREIFEFALSTILEHTSISRAVFTLEIEPASFVCAACGRQWSLAEAPGMSDETREAIHFLPEAAHAFIRCPACESPDYRISAGRGVSIDRLEIDAVEPGE
jgi:hydrogenase nickel incorporation protein HypA/HybF